MKDSIPIYTARTLQRRAELQDKARAFVRRSKSHKTLRTYENAWRDVLDFCTAEQLDPLPATPETISLYIAYAADHARVSTIQ